MTRPQLRTIAGYGAFFWVWFALFAYWTFPYDRVSAYLTDHVNQGDSGYKLEIGSLSPYWLTGVELEEVKLQRSRPMSSPASGDGKADDGAFKIREARARLSILPLLIGNRALSFDAALEQGALEGEYEIAGDTQHVVATLSKIDLAKLGILDSVVPLPIRGDVGGKFDLTLDKEVTKSTGSATLTIHGLTIGDGKAKFQLGVMGGITIDPIEAGTVVLELDLKQGVGTVKKLTTDGKDVELDGSGEIRFADPVARSRVNVLLRFKFTDSYRNKSGRTKALFGLLDSAAVRQVESAKTSDGALQFRLVGTLGALRASPAGRSGDSSRARPGAWRGAANGPDEADGE